MNFSNPAPQSMIGGAAARADDDIARVGPGTPGGQFLRQFGVPIHRSEDLSASVSIPIRIVGENFALYRGRSGKAQVMAYHCPHRRAPMQVSWVEEDKLRCMYHGCLPSSPMGQIEVVA